MKKLILLIGLILLAACGNVTPESTATPAAMSTRITPTTEPATVTPTIAPSPTVTPFPERFFTEEFDSAPNYWSILYASGDSNRVEVLDQNSKLTFEIYTIQAWMYAIYEPLEYDSVHVETRVQNIGSNINAMGLVCGYNEQTGWYEFNISSDGSYTLFYGEWLAEGIARYTPILYDQSELIVTGKATNEIGLDCYENTLQLYINGKLFRKIDVEYLGLTGGKVGLSLASFEEAPVILSFDWVKVSEP